MINPFSIFGSFLVSGKESTHPVSTLLSDCRQAFRFVVLMTFCIELLSVSPLLYMWNMFDRVMASRSEVTLVSLTSLVLGVYCFWAALDWIRSRMLVRISLRIDWDIAAKAFDASFRRYVGRKNVNVHQVLGDVMQLRQFLTGSALLAVMSAPYALVFLIVGAIFHPFLAVFILVSTTLLLLVTYMTTRITTPVLMAANESQADANRLAAQSLRLAESALVLGMLKTLRSRWYQKHQGFLQLQVNASEAAGLLGGLSGFLTKAFPSLQMALGVYLAIEGHITGGMVIAATFLISKAVSPIQKVMGSWKEITSARQALDRLDQLLVEDDQQQERLTLPPPLGNLEVQQLYFVPSGSKKGILSGISFKVAPGQVIALVGPSASGKTSLIKMLIGIHKPSSGSVRLDGANVDEWIRDDLGGQMGYVPQDVEFFEGTIAENIARFSGGNDEKVIEAAKLADIHELILTFPQGYETRLGETGFVLTGGQKQRLALARALYGQPRYVVLDEPNANLDESGERALNVTLRKLKAAGCTVIFSTHRPQLIGVADFVLVLKEGQQVVFGPIREVLAGLQKTVDAKTAQENPAPSAAAGVQNTSPSSQPA